MRQTLSISITPTLKRQIDQVVKAGRYASTSELIREALRQLEYKQIVNDLKRSQAAARKGRTHKLSSLRGLRS